MLRPLAQFVLTLVATVYLAAAPLAAEHRAVLAISDDWSQEASLAADSGAPILLLVTSPDCGYCEQLKKQVIMPLLEHPKEYEPLIIREFSTTTSGKIADFDGERIRARIFLRRLDVFATPTVILLDPQGSPLTPALVGFNSVDDYLPRLEQNVSRASQAMHAWHPDTTPAGAF